MPYLTEAQANALRSTRSLDETSRKRRKAALMAEIKRALGIPQSTKISFELDDKYSPKYLRVNDAATKMEWQPPERPTRTVAMGTPASAPVAARPAPATLPPQAAWPYPTPVQERAVHAAPAGISAVAPERPAPRAVTGPELAIGSIALDDLVSLLRVEGDGRDTFRKTSAQANAETWIDGGRIYFVL